MNVADEKFSSSSATAFTAPDRRRFPRSLYGEKVTILWAGPPISGIIRNVSDCGMAFSVDRADGAHRFPIGSRLRLLFTPPHAEGGCVSVNVIGDVVRLSNDDAPDRIVVAVAFRRL